MKKKAEAPRRRITKFVGTESELMRVFQYSAVVHIKAVAEWRVSHWFPCLSSA